MIINGHIVIYRHQISVGIKIIQIDKKNIRKIYNRLVCIQQLDNVFSLGIYQVQKVIILIIFDDKILNYAFFFYVSIKKSPCNYAASRIHRVDDKL